MSYNPAIGGVFCYNNDREKKNFRPMKNRYKVALGLLGGVVMLNLLSVDRNPKKRCGRRRNMKMYEIPNNGGR